MPIETILLIRMSVLFFCAFLNLFFTFILWREAKNNRACFHLGFVAFFGSLYAFVFAMLFMPGSDKTFWSRITWIGVFIVPAYLSFVLIFFGKLKRFRLISSLWYSVGAAIFILAVATPLVIIKTSSEYPYSDENGIFDLFGRLYIIFGLVVSLYYLLVAYFSSDATKKVQLQYFILGTLIYVSGGILIIGLAPIFIENFGFIDISAWVSIPWIGLTTYAIVKKQLFDIKVFLTETLVIGFFLMLMAQLIFGNFVQPIFIALINLALFLPIGYLMIVASHKEIRKNEILEQKVQERTKDLQNSNQALEQSKKIAEERAEELEKWYKLTIGREVRMAELKGQIKELEEKVK